ncbi:trypsin-like peptidase domain-containing protein [bacterium]|nr:trypsin-like peptidase domain-containing protein [bacterium]
MDTFEENNDFSSSETEEPRVEPRVEPSASEPRDIPSESPYSGAGVGRKESPYANSPYVTGHQEQQYHYEPQTQPPQKPPKVRKSHKSLWKTLTALVLVVALVAGGCLITAASVNSRWEKRAGEAVAELNEKIADLQDQIDGAASEKGYAALPADGSAMTPSQLYSENVDSVVAITSFVQTTNFYGTSSGTSSGSGFILTEDGYVVTNYHVVEGGTDIRVVLHNGDEYPAEIVGFDATNDLAVLKVDASGLSAAAIGSSSELNIGDMVVAIGNPLGTLASTQTVGYVSGINREVTTDNTIISMIQTDAAINPGNSGGPLFNTKGEVIGITTAKYSGTTNSGASIEGIGFAIPIDDVIGMVSDLIDYGYVTGAYLGVTVKNTDAESASMFGLPTGAYVVSVEKGGSADRAGIHVKDIIIDLGGTKVSNITDLTRALRNYKAGDSTTITVVRSGSQVTLDITLDEKPHDNDTVTIPENDSEMPSEGDYDEWYDYFRRYFGN